MKTMHTADTLFITQHTHDVESWTMLRDAKLMGRIDVRTDVIAQGIQLLTNNLPSTSSIMSRQC